MIELFTAPTPNGYKISIMLEETGLAYDLRVINLGELEQKQDWFLNINPNGRIPAIIDHDADNLAIFESGAILIYLAEKAGQFLSNDPRARMAAIQWLMFQMGGLGPMQGQAHVFLRYAPEKIPFAIERYQKETKRLYRVLDTRLKESEYLAGDISIADFANYPWVRSHRWAGLEIDDLPHLSRWYQSLGQRPGVQRGMEKPPRNLVSKDKVEHIGKKIIT